MLRTILIVRNQNFLRATIQRTAKRNTIRSFSNECVKKINSHRALLGNIKNIGNPAIWKIETTREYCSALPKHTKVPLPALSPTMEMGTIISWEKKEGDKLNEGDLLAEIETDKATMGFETPEEGYLAKIMIQAGTKEVKVGKLLCIIVEKESDIAAFKDFKDTGEGAPAAAPAASAPPPAASVPASPVAAAAPTPPRAATQQLTAVEQKFGDRVFASPMAKKLAESQKLRLEGRGSGLFGSLKAKDVTNLGPAQPAMSGTSAGHASTPPPAPAPGAAFVDIPVSNIRAVIAHRLVESKTTIPHYYLTRDCNVEQIVKLRSRLNKEYEKKGIKLSLNDFVVKAVAMACRKVPEANSYWMDSYIRQFSNVDVCVAVSTERGLITPIVFNADRKGLIEISNDVKSLAAKARDGKLKPQEFQGGTITVSNLGMYGTTFFSAIINPPQSCIIALGTTQDRIIPDQKSETGFKAAQIMSATLSCDHRVIDGAIGAQWLQYFQKYIEDPVQMIV